MPPGRGKVQRVTYGEVRHPLLQYLGDPNNALVSRIGDIELRKMPFHDLQAGLNSVIRSSDC